MMDMIGLFLRDFCEPVANKTKPGELCYKVTKFSWHLLADLSQTISVLDDKTFCIQIWYMGSTPGYYEALSKYSTIRTLHLSLIEQAQKESRRWMKDKNTIESYMTDLCVYMNLSKNFTASDANSELIKSLIQQSIVILEKMNRFDKGFDLEPSELLGDIHRDLDKKMGILSVLLGNDKNENGRDNDSE
jgi:hypothetical protein